MLNDLRDKIPWFPIIDADACRADLQCLNFCPHDVFAWDPASGLPTVAHPLQCLPGCQICVEGCTTGAISLPSRQEFRAKLKKSRAISRRTHDSSPRPPTSPRPTILPR